MDAYRNMISEGKRPLIIDCGANIGLASIWFSINFPEAIVYAIEPDRDNFQMLRKNVGEYKQVVPLLGGIWDHSAYLKIDNPDAGSAAFQVSEVEKFSNHDEPPSSAIRAYSVAEIFAMAKCKEALIVKVDIEGAESMLFRTNTDWLLDTRLLIIELHDWLFPWKGTSRTFLSCISQLRFDFLFKDENAFFLKYEKYLMNHSMLG